MSNKRLRDFSKKVKKSWRCFNIFFSELEKIYYGIKYLQNIAQFIDKAIISNKMQPFGCIF